VEWSSSKNQTQKGGQLETWPPFCFLATWHDCLMFAAQFIFTPGTYDEEFHELDQSIDNFAQSLEGFRGVDKWVSPDGTRQNSIYYWADRESLSEFSSFPDHLTAKKRYSEWYDSYQVIISEVVAQYGDGGENHPLTSVKS